MHQEWIVSSPRLSDTFISCTQTHSRLTWLLPLTCAFKIPRNRSHTQQANQVLLITAYEQQIRQQRGEALRKKNIVCVCVYRLHSEYLAVMCRVLTLLCFGFFPPTELFTRKVWATRRIEKLKPQTQRDCEKNLPSSALLKRDTYWQVMQSTAIQRLLISYPRYDCSESADGLEISRPESHVGRFLLQRPFTLTISNLHNKNVRIPVNVKVPVIVHIFRTG